MPIQITRYAETSDGMTLGELHQFIQTALAHNIDPHTPLKIVAGFRSQIKTITTGTLDK
ncbi:hypothetical protein [Psychromicrobium lacuslunae]|uniref:hypothetical protein n=1 Tax=Psychromicrobium lacuslunae TaxID=1618207 RepID=UPI0012FF1235|nr:hypothetical protein [Psychromicrobium lacuslunae]